jgi:curved DNA-binding protein CbpA
MTHYETLGIHRRATQAEVTAAFRRMGMRWHPDRNPGDAVASTRFKEVTQAYRILRDPALRLRYDLELDRLVPSLAPVRAEPIAPRQPSKAAFALPRPVGDRPARRGAWLLPLATGVLLTVSAVALALHHLGPPRHLVEKLSMMPPLAGWSASRAIAQSADASLDRRGPLDREDMLAAALKPLLRSDTADGAMSAFLHRVGLSPLVRDSARAAPGLRAFRLQEFDWREGVERRKAVLVLSLPPLPDEYCRPCDATLGVALLGQDRDRVLVVDANLDVGHFGSYGWFSTDDASILDLGEGRMLLRLIDRPESGGTRSARIDLLGLWDGRVRPIGSIPFDPGPPPGRNAGQRDRSYRPVVVDADVQVLQERDARGIARLGVSRQVQDAPFERRTLPMEVWEFDGTRFVAVRSVEPGQPFAPVVR